MLQVWGLDMDQLHSAHCVHIMLQVWGLDMNQLHSAHCVHIMLQVWGLDMDQLHSKCCGLWLPLFENRYVPCEVWGAQSGTAQTYGLLRCEASPDVLKEHITFLFDRSTIDDENCMFLCNGNSSWTPMSLKMKAIPAFKRRALLQPPDLLSWKLYFFFFKGFPSLSVTTGK